MTTDLYGLSALIRRASVRIRGSRLAETVIIAFFAKRERYWRGLETNALRESLFSATEKPW